MSRGTGAINRLENIEVDEEAVLHLLVLQFLAKVVQLDPVGGIGIVNFIRETPFEVWLSFGLNGNNIRGQLPLFPWVQPGDLNFQLVQ